MCKRKYRSSSSEESIENVLYYQDCKHKREQPEPEKLRASEAPPPKPQECKMSCRMCCGEKCQQTFVGKTAPNKFQQAAFLPKPPSIKPKTPPRLPVKSEDTTNNFDIQHAFLGRRDLSLTKENIKNLISQDADIRKILRDLVRVTMQKADLMQMLSARRNIEKEKSVNDDNDL
ncbi:unnamed protein product [Leptidea sinapis]|uniref:Uncharacterized protein n=1 Tax=Leptidea sinapis TaxID=189913 RepID=A0A5E4Q7T3_9NEOP|nr:unnamed protein product [Leptidea sinapis]